MSPLLSVAILVRSRKRQDRVVPGILLGMAVENEWRETAGTPVLPEEAWRILDNWKMKQKEIGMLYCGRSGTAAISAMCTVRGLRNGLLRMKGEAMGASLNLRMAKFSYGPMKVWPNWPSGPIAEVLALQVYLPGGDWLVLAEGYVPKELAPLALSM